MERNKKIIIAFGITLALLLFVSVAFAALASNLNISFGNVTQNALSWNVGFKGSSATPAADGTSSTGLSCGTATITPSTVTISDSTLSKPGDKCTYDLTIENKGDISANLSAIVAIAPTGVSCDIQNNSTMVCGNITYKLTTISGINLTTGITINKSEKYNIKLIAFYNADSLTSTAISQNGARFQITYTQNENRTTVGSSAPEGVEGPKCKRATTLHTEECTNSTNGCYTAGYTLEGEKQTTTITYGFLGNKGTLTPGDAFDCDVNGDGIYDAATERFYYVSNMDGDDSNEYAVLIYYTNVIGGEILNTGKQSYSTYVSSMNYKNTVGPRDGYKELPSTTQWKNVNLYSQSRTIYSELGRAKCSFTYTDKSSRLLSYKELTKSCNVTINSTGDKGASLVNNSSCEYLFEHTHYATNGDDGYNYWMETPRGVFDTGVWYINGNTIRVSDGSTDTKYGIRPAIEVLKSDIDY